MAILDEIGIGELQDVLVAVALLSPGVLISYFRNTFVTGRHPKIADRAVELLFISAVYYSVFGSVFFIIGYWNWWSLLALSFGIPSLIGFFLGAAAQKRWFDKLFELLGINPIHPATTGWDYMFGTMQNPKWIIVTLSDGTKVYGWFDRESGASTDLDRRDIFIADVRRENFEPFECDGRARGIWLREDEIKHIEIVSDGD